MSESVAYDARLGVGDVVDDRVVARRPDRGRDREPGQIRDAGRVGGRRALCGDDRLLGVVVALAEVDRLVALGRVGDLLDREVVVLVPGLVGLVEGSHDPRDLIRREPERVRHGVRDGRLVALARVRVVELPVVILGLAAGEPRREGGVVRADRQLPRLDVGHLLSRGAVRGPGDRLGRGGAACARLARGRPGGAADGRLVVRARGQEHRHRREDHEQLAHLGTPSFEHATRARGPAWRGD